MDSFFDRTLLLARQLRASDVHFKPGLSPVLRIAGELRTLSDVPPLSREFLHSLGLSLLNDRRREALERTGDVIVALATSNGGRQRAHLFHHRGGLSLALRLIPPEVPALDTLGLPAETRELTEPGAGLVVVAAGPGDGKTTTLAALVEDLTSRRPCRVLTLEEPVEHLLRDRHGVVVQREVGTDVPSAAAGLRAASRQDVDVLVVSDLGDPEVARLAVEAAESGRRLVLGGIQAASLGQAIDRLTPPAGSGEPPRARLAAVLRGVLVQRLVPTIPGKRRGAAGVLLRVDPETRARLAGAASLEASDLPGSQPFEPVTEPPRRRRGGEARAAVEDEAADD
ncbi:MAG TPA: ATPase, T2SS/T4P/T4SS family [Polyangia bacterium]|nr:ATPase, T2SS/T4P/T4SS family [Polyangia bacterium]